MQAAPHFLLLAESRRRNRCGDWRFVLQTPAGQRHLEVAEAEPKVGGERLELLAVVRGLEALDQPSQVTLLTPSSYVTRGLSYGLEEWRSNDWQWERYGQMVPVKDGDLWRRLDHALKFHRLECRKLRADRAHGLQLVELAAVDEPESPVEVSTSNDPLETCDARSPKRRSLRHTLLSIRKQCAVRLSRVRLRLAQLGTGLLPRPWFE
jgi:ribonuclease HI